MGTGFNSEKSKKLNSNIHHVIVCIMTIVLIGLTVVLLGCSQDNSITEPQIPSHYTTYTDETELFSVSFPPEWETALSSIDELDSSVEAIINSIDSNIPIENSSIIFFGGKPTLEGYLPSMNITVEPLASGISTHDGYVEAVIEGLQIFEDFRLISQNKTKVGGRTATILDYELNYLSMGKCQLKLLCLIVGRTGWGLGCGALKGEYSFWEEDFNAIVRSLRIFE